VTKAKITNYGNCEKLERNYPDAHLLLWTEECWKLQGARAVSYNPKLNYILVKHKQDYLLLAEKRLGEFIARLGDGKAESFKPLLVMSGE